MARLIVRCATADDNEDADALQQRVFSDLRHLYRPSTIEIARPQAASYCWSRLVALGEDRIVGTTYYRIEKSRLFIRSLAVDSLTRRKGVARLLVEFLRETGRRQGCKVLALYTLDITGNPAVFQKLGFTTLRIEPAIWAESPTGEKLIESYMESPIKT